MRSRRHVPISGFPLFALIIFILAFCLSALAESADTYISDFSKGTDGWYANAGANGRVRVLDGALHISGRDADWNGPMRDFQLIPGKEYEISAEVRQEEKDNATVVISVTRVKNGEPSWENIVSGGVKRGVWTRISETWTPGDFDAFSLYVETSGSPELSYAVRDFQVTEPGADAEPVELSFWTVLSGADGQAMDDLVDAFNKSQSAVRVTHRAMYEDDLYEALERIGTEGGESPQLCLVNPERIAGLAGINAIAPFDLPLLEEAGVREKDFDGAQWVLGRSNGEQYGIPLDLHMNVLYYDRALWSQYELNSFIEDGFLTFRELEPLAKKARAMGYTGDITNIGWMRPQILSYYAQKDKAHTLFDPEAPAVDREVLKAALTEMKALAAEGYVSDPEADSIAAFCEGRLLVMTDGTWIQPTLREVGVDYGMLMSLCFSPEECRTWASAHHFVRTADKAVHWRVEQAEGEFIRFMSENALTWAEKGGHCPAALSALEQAAYQQLPQASLTGPLYRDRSVVFTVPCWPALDRAVSGIGWDVLDGSAPIEDALDRVEEQYRAAVSARQGARPSDLGQRYLKDPSALFAANPRDIQGIGDPFTLRAGSRYATFATGGSVGFSGWFSRDLTVFEKKRVMRSVSWASGDYWAPEVYQIDGRYLMLFTARSLEDGHLHTGIAFSDRLEGPYEDPLGRPLLDPRYTTIDATLTWDDDGNPYMIYALDCSENLINNVSVSQIYGVPLAPDYLSAVGEPVLLTSPKGKWERLSVDPLWNEGPAVLRHDGKYYLFYSVNGYFMKEYSVCVAVADQPLGHYVRQKNNPIMRYAEDKTGVLVSGPGHNAFFRVGDGLFTSYHTHTYPEAPSGNRQFCVDRAGFHADGTAYINGPTLAPQLRPLSDIGAVDRIPLAACTGDKKGLLSDGDFCYTTASADWVWKNKKAAFTWEKPVSASLLLIYPAQGQRVKGRVVLNGKTVLSFEKGKSALPGEMIILPFDTLDVERLELQMTEGRLGEIQLF